MTFDVRRFLRKYNLWWKTTFYEGHQKRLKKKINHYKGRAHAKSLSSQGLPISSIGHSKRRGVSRAEMLVEWNSWNGFFAQNGLQTYKLWPQITFCTIRVVQKAPTFSQNLKFVSTGLQIQNVVIWYICVEANKNHSKGAVVRVSSFFICLISRDYPHFWAHLYFWAVLHFWVIFIFQLVF